MSELPPDPATVPPLAAVPVPAPAGSALPARWRVAATWAMGAALALLTVAAMAVAWRANQRIGSLEQELVRRQQESAGQAVEARLVAREAQDSVRDAGAKVALLEARVGEISVQRVQLDELIQSLSRSRDENLLGDLEAALRVAAQQTVVTGSAEPLVAALRQADDRLARTNEPRLEGVRRAVAHDLERIKSTAVSDIPSLGIKIDEAIRLVDELPLAASADAHREPGEPPSPAPVRPASAPEGVAALASWAGTLGDWWNVVAGRVWAELRALVRVTRVDHPEALLLAPDQAFFVRENLKLRLLNARLALLSRQGAAVQSDLGVARASVERYFDRNSRRTGAALDLLWQIASQASQTAVPRPDETLAALGAAAARR